MEHDEHGEQLWHGGVHCRVTCEAGWGQERGRGSKTEKERARRKFKGTWWSDEGRRSEVEPKMKRLVFE